jgi:hypothetical protein
MLLVCVGIAIDNGPCSPPSLLLSSSPLGLSKMFTVYGDEKVGFLVELISNAAVAVHRFELTYDGSLPCNRRAYKMGI